MKFKHVLLVTFLVLFADQALKIYIKTQYYMGQEVVPVNFLPWFRLHFIENEGMAYGWKLGGEWGKIALTLFRLVAVGFGTYYILDILKKNYHKGYIICVSFIYAGAIGNLIDSLFYGIIFEGSDAYTQNLARVYGVMDLLEAMQAFSTVVSLTCSTCPLSRTPVSLPGFPSGVVSHLNSFVRYST